MKESTLSRDSWPEWRMRFLLRKRPTAKQYRCLQKTDLVSFISMDSVGEYGGLNLETIRAKSEVEKGYTLFFNGDVVVAKITPCFENGKGALASGLYQGVAYGTTELHVLSPLPMLNRRFLFYLTICHSFRIQGEAEMKGAAGQKRVPDEFIQDFRFRLPSLDIQKNIADYLDAETAQIDALVAEKKRMLKLLEEKRTALISQVVTRGLNPDAPMKSSGLDWLGEIPAHWEVKRAKQVFAIRDERSEAGDEELLTVSHLTGVTPRSEKEVFMFKAENMSGYKLCYPGDLVVNTLWAWMGAMGIASQYGIVSPDYHVYIPRNGLRSAYIEALCRSKPFVAEVIRHSKGVWSSRLRLYPEALFDMHLPVPPIQEQEAIVDTLTCERARTEELETSLYRSITLLKERRSALITEAVTGQLDLQAVTA